jgi:hypothetical protein
MFILARKHRSHLLVVLVAVGVLAVPLVCAHWGFAQQQVPQEGLKKWTLKYLAIQNWTDDEVEVHLKYVSRPCVDCMSEWLPSAPGKPGDIKIVLKPYEGDLILDENSRPIAVSRFRFYAVSRQGGLPWDFTKEDIWVLDPKLGYYEAPEMLTHFVTLAP